MTVANDLLGIEKIGEQLKDAEDHINRMEEGSTHSTRLL